MLQLMAPLPDDSDGGLIIRDEHRKFIDVFLFFGSSILEIKPLGLNFFMESQEYMSPMLWISFPRNPSARPARWSTPPALLVMPSP
jgi:hypothetical protein